MSEAIATKLDEARALIGDGQLSILRAMAEDSIRRESETASFSVRVGLLLDMIDEIQAAREAERCALGMGKK